MIDNTVFEADNSIIVLIFEKNIKGRSKGLCAQKL